ncbi:hypothetical protein RW1_082_00020 [Rhodococcus wratislaviensis NBRC 100605]|uniref:Uncharacterized protein n=1 Tax=Rhodococcus wratislaviensis NBRC 100605 TaxID=1219028 RepID=X0REE2_RHOWR|nr:hypothetical protein RW1_082_00020 [Rhodococcus wratislaviensis NBRC 100605]
MSGNGTVHIFLQKALPWPSPDRPRRSYVDAGTQRFSDLIVYVIHITYFGVHLTLRLVPDLAQSQLPRKRWDQFDRGTADRESL